MRAEVHAEHAWIKRRESYKDIGESYVVNVPQQSERERAL
jgi:hypothetical protein